MDNQRHQPWPFRPRKPTRESLADIKLDGYFSPAETILLDLSDTWDALPEPNQSAATGEKDNAVTSTLKRLLSLNPNISAVPSESESESAKSPSTSSKQNSEEDQQQPKGDERTFRKIGAGQCGAVFATSLSLKPGGQQAFKFAKVATSSCSPAQGETSLLNDYIHHHQVFKQFRRFLGDTSFPRNNDNSSAEGSPHAAAAPVMDITTPRVYDFTLAEDSHPETFRNPNCCGLITAAEKEGGIHHPLPTDILKTERIVPLPLAARNALIDRFLLGSEEAKQAAKDDPANADCLVRVYLGANKDPEPGQGTPWSNFRSRFFSLRNFKLHLNQLTDLRLENDAREMAKQMAFSLAIMHWAAKTDARDVEFVLGSSREQLHQSQQKPTDDNAASAEASPELKRGEPVRSTQLWLLDFNQCRSTTFTKGGVNKMIEAIKLNDPYFPKPLRESAFERAVWTVFVRAYLAASELILEEELGLDVANAEENSRQKEEMSEIFGLPYRFIMGVIKLEKGRIEQRGRTSTT